MYKVTPEAVSGHDCAPIAFFAFNRPKHTAITLKALQNAALADKSSLYIFLDGPRSDDDRPKILETLLEIENITGFRQVIVKQRSENLGLARNICEGIDEVLKENESIIVLEDDIEVSKTFILFCNMALAHYKEKKEVWHISGYNEAIGLHDEAKTFLWRFMRCWGWATWRDRWSHFNKGPSSLISSFCQSDIDRFNLDGSENLWAQVRANHEGRIDTWAIFWYATIFQNSGLCLNPVVSLVRNIGFDGSGVHCGIDDGKHSVHHLNSSSSFAFPPELIEDKQIVDQIKRHYQSFKPSSIQRLASKLRRLIRALVPW